MGQAIVIRLCAPEHRKHNGQPAVRSMHQPGFDHTSRQAREKVKDEKASTNTHQPEKIPSNEERTRVIRCGAANTGRPVSHSLPTRWSTPLPAQEHVAGDLDRRLSPSPPPAALVCGTRSALPGDLGESGGGSSRPPSRRTPPGSWFDKITPPALPFIAGQAPTVTRSR